MAQRHHEIGKRQQARKRILDSRAGDAKYHRECVERRERRVAAFLLSDALDLVDEIPVPGALEKVADGQYRATMEGAEYIVTLENGIVRFRFDSKKPWEGSLRNLELGPIGIEWGDED